MPNRTEIRYCNHCGKRLIICGADYHGVLEHHMSMEHPNVYYIDLHTQFSDKPIAEFWHIDN